MIKKIFGITTLLFLSVFLIMPVYASEPNPFEKTTNVFPGDLDYRNSLVDWNGYNLEFEIIKDTAGGLDPTNSQLDVYENGVFLFTLSSWVKLYPDDPFDFQYKLNMTSTQKTKIKTLLFDRKDGLSGSFFSGIVLFMRNAPGTTQGWAMYFRLYFSSLLNINFNSLYLSDYLNQSNVGVLSGFTKGVLLKDQQDIAIANITVDTESTQPIGLSQYQRALYNFTNKYTNVKSIDLVYAISANNYDPRPTVQYFISEIGFFADTQVILPDLNVDTDFQIYQPTICGLFDLACISRNLIGELSNTVYNRLGADNIASSILDIYDTLFYPVYIIDNSAWQNAILAIYAMLSIGIIVMIIKRVT